MVKTLEASQAPSADNTVPKTVAKTIEQAIEAAILDARTTCELQGTGSSKCAVAWDIVEELQAERSHRCADATFKKNSLERYCDEHPNANECRMYDV